ncbi:MAG: tRNA (adenosine(37)-N6)-dimethylallyltransferase MiaA [Bacteroidia bacterium]|nr:tRNA (adenosine(37)-N6)-dimethylallyltransferase MiaA [Bacteroidia bacterium]
MSYFSQKTLICIAGPTAVGKTALSLHLAKRYDTAIVSADARQVYCYLDIGTAKPTPEERGDIPHAFIDILTPDQPYNAGLFAREARQWLDDWFETHEVAIVAGGSTLYLDALLYGMDAIPPASGEVREALKLTFEQEGLSPLLAELATVDPATYAVVDRQNPARIIRALEVWRSSGHPISAFRTGPKSPALPWQVITIGLTDDRDRLYDRINRRVDEMMDRGLLQEVTGLLNMGYSPDLHALQTIGYQELIAFLQGQTDLTAAVERIKQNSRRYAKRQLTWMRRYEDITWVEAGTVRTPGGAFREEWLDALLHGR